LACTPQYSTVYKSSFTAGNARLANKIAWTECSHHTSMHLFPLLACWAEALHPGPQLMHLLGMWQNYLLDQGILESQNIIR
jgi:hypothetical protein